VRESLIGIYGRTIAELKRRSPQGDCDAQPPSILERWKAAGRRIRNFVMNPRQSIRLFLYGTYREGCYFEALMKRVGDLQEEMARTAAILIRDVLKPLWEEEKELTVSEDSRINKPPLPLYRAIAEEYAALVYINFLVSVLLRIRTLVICAGGM